jgi:cytochrome P450
MAICFTHPNQSRRKCNAAVLVCAFEGGRRNLEGRLLSKVLLTQGPNILTNSEISGLTSNLIVWGVDTTTSTMVSFILACVAFPEALKPACEELDRIAGDRMPEFSDEKDLPYCQAMIKEVLRWRSVAVLGGLPYAPINDDIYRGYHIPAGTSIMVFPLYHSC